MQLADSSSRPMWVCCENNAHQDVAAARGSTRIQGIERIITYQRGYLAMRPTKKGMPTHCAVQSNGTAISISGYSGEYQLIERKAARGIRHMRARPA